MRHATQVDLLRRFAKLHADRTTELAQDVRQRDVAIYCDPDRAARERAALFTHRPQVAALSGDLPEPGTAVAVDVGDVSVLLVRGEDNVVRAFHNACRHRGSRIVEGHCQPGRAVSCPFHAWTYDLNGRLLGQPIAQDAFAGIDTDDLALVSIPAAEVGGLVLVAPGAHSIDDPEGWLGGLAPELAEWSFDTFRFFEERVVTVEANWKLVYDTYLEGYHIFSLHRRTVGQVLLSTPAVADRYGPHGRAVVYGRDVPAMVAEQPEDQWDLKAHSSIVYQLFPNAVLNLPQSGHAELWQVFPDPAETTRCRVHLRFYTPGEVADDRARAFYRSNLDFTHRVVVEEDFGQQEAIQRNMSSGLMRTVVHGRNEPPLQHFHDMIQARLAE